MVINEMPKSTPVRHRRSAGSTEPKSAMTAQLKVAKPKSKSRVEKIKASLIREATYGWIGTAGDLALVSLAAAIGLSGAAYSSRSGGKIISNAGKLFTSLRASRLQKSLRHGLYQIADKGWRDNWTITDAGYKHLRDLVPKYTAPQDRLWDGSLYLVMFDIPENLSRSRDKLRRKLLEIDFRLLQKSTWVGFENPRESLRQIIDWNELDDFVLICRIKKGGFITDKPLRPLMAKVFKLDLQNSRYQAFLDRVKELPQNSADQKDKIVDLALRFLAILKADPQLPEKLLPPDWLGDQAFAAYQDRLIPRLPHESQDFFFRLLTI